MEFLYKFKAIRRLNIAYEEAKYREITESHALILVKEGKGEIGIEDKRWLLDTGTIFYCNPNTLYEIIILPNKRIIIDILYFHRLEEILSHSELITFQVSNSEWHGAGLLSTDVLYRAEQLIGEIGFLEEQEQQQLIRDKFFYELISIIDTTATKHSPKQQIEYVINYMQDNYSLAIHRDDLGKLAGFHPRTFSQLFKDEMGISFNEYLANIRINRTKELLLTTDLNLNEIARKVGYSDGIYLSKKFKQIEGIPPIKYHAREKRLLVYDLVGYVLALGIQPLGASYYMNLTNLVLHQEELKNVLDIRNCRFDEIVRLEPEIIFVPEWIEADLLKKLKKIAPTILIRHKDPIDRLKLFASILGREKEAELFLEEYNKKGAAIKAKLQQQFHKEETFAVYQVLGEQVWVMSELYGRGAYNLYNILGLMPPKIIQKEILKKTRLTPIPISELKKYSANHMFIIQEGSEPLLEHEAFIELMEDGKHKTYFIQKNVFHSGDIYSLFKQLDIQEKLLTQKIT